MAIGETISEEEFQSRYGVGSTISKRRFEKMYLGIQPDFASEAEELTRQADWMQSPAGIAIGTAKAIPGAAAKLLLQGPAKFAASAAEALPFLAREAIAPGTTAASQREYNLPVVGRFKSFLSEAEQRREAGVSPLLNVGQAALEVPLAGLETLGAVRGTQRLFRGAKGAVGRFRQIRRLEGTMTATAPVPTRSEKVRMFKRSGKPGGIEETGRIFKRAQGAPTIHDVDVANEARGIGIVDPSDPVNNIIKVNDRIAQISEEGVKPFLKANNYTYSNKSLSAKLNAIDPPDLVKSDKVLENAYDLVRKRVLKTVSQGDQSMEGLWESRKGLDSTMEREFGEALWNPENALHVPVKRAYLDMRRALNEFIVENIGEGGGEYAELLRKEHLLYEAAQNMAEQSYKLLGKSGWVRFWSQHPSLNRVGQISGGLGAIGGAAGIVNRIFGNRGVNLNR